MSLKLLCGVRAGVYAAFAAWPAMLHAGAPDIKPRFAVHETFDRLVIGLPDGGNFTTKLAGDALTLTLVGVGHVAGLDAPGHRLISFTGGEGLATIRMAHGTHPRIMRLDNRLVVDVDDGPAPQAAPQEAAPAAARARTVAAGHVQVIAVPARKMAHARNMPAVASDAPALAGPWPAPLLAPVAEALAPPVPAAIPQPDTPPALVAVPPAAAPPVLAPPVPLPVALPVVGGGLALTPTGSMPRAAITLLGNAAGLGGPAMLVPFGADTGAAAFGRGGVIHIIFDAARPLDLSQLKDDPVFGGVTEQVLPDGMRLRLEIPGDSQVRLVRHDGGWAVCVVRGLAALAAIPTHADHGVISFSAASPGRVVVLDDEATGGKLLVGTQRVAGQYVPSPRRSAEFALPETWQGVVVEPVADRLELRPVRDGFELTASDGPKLATAWVDAPASARVMTRRFDLPDLPESVLRNRLSLAMRDAALTPKLSRFPARLRVAQAMLAEGLDVEARGVLHAATADDPAHADDPDAAGLAAIATWFVARAGGANAQLPDNFDPASMGNSDEAQFWRALFKAAGPDLAEPAATLAVEWPLLLQYPQDLRHRLVPEVARILAEGGQDKALDTYLKTFADPSLDLVRAGRLWRQGKTDEALSLLDAVAKRPDRLMRAEALRDAVEWRLASKKMDVATAAEALGRQIYAWRSGPGDLALRLRIADLRLQAGEWRRSLALLRETDTDYPEAHAQVHEAETKLIAALLHGDRAAKLSALDLVALADEASTLLSAADADAALAPVLVDKLLALDLPARAEPILQRLFDHAEAPAQKAELGVRLATLQADRGDAKQALSVLGASDDAGLPSDLVTRRAMLRARLLVLSGKAADALGVLAGVKGEVAVEMQAKILEDRHDWSSASKLLESLVGSDAFASKGDSGQRDLILRLANDESQAGDMAALRRLRAEHGAHLASGPGAELFAVLTQEPIQAVDDLPRSSHELAAVRALPASLATR